jgi:hypothetical protein
MLGVKDDADAAEVTLGSMRLLVNVAVFVVLIEGAAGYVTNTFTVPENVTAAFELLDESMVVRVNVGPVVEYVPKPTSQFPDASVAE